MELEHSRLEFVLDTIESYARDRDVIPVILTDCPTFEVFRRRGLAFEYLPSRSAQKRFASDLSWPLYVRRRIALYQAKWRPIGVVAFGSRAPLHGAVEFSEAAKSVDGNEG